MFLRRLIFLALVIGGMAYLQWQAIPLPKPPKPARLVEEPWDLPQLRQPDPKQQLAVLNGANLWGKLPEGSAGASLNDPEWRFLGAMARGAERYVLIKVENQPEQRLTMGDRLPGGSTILKIENDRLCLRVNGKKRRLDIYPQAQALQKLDADKRR